MKNHVWNIGIGLVITGGVGMVIDFFLDRIPSIEFRILLVSLCTGVIAMIISHFWFKIVKPLKLKVNELTCWHIERPEPEHRAWKHCHEYNFAGQISIIPRVEAIVTAFYLELPMTNGQVLRVEYQIISPNVLSEIAPDKPIAKEYVFQIRLSEEIKIPSYGYVVLKFYRGKARKKVSIELDDEYRPRLGGKNDTR